MTRSLPALLVATALAATPVLAQSSSVVDGPRASSTKGFFIGAHLNGSAVEIDEFGSDRESGGGLGLHLGYGFTPSFALVIDGTAARLDLEGETAALAHVDVSLRYAFTSPTRRFVPFLEAGYAGRALGVDDVDFGDGLAGDLTLSGSGFTFGGGAQFYASPSVALGASVKWMAGEFDTVKLDDVSVDGLGLDASSARVNIGLTWYPRGGR